VDNDAPDDKKTASENVSDPTKFISRIFGMTN
jgi:hypothetical protein